ncbi:acyl-CoA dehydrogenase family protein [Catenuloplanes sp. NPDC051500]|uniref:acyl-CoA dehydrogenase family protein n=1 Tax=Catenuloplanes sp. NPDC051500 TaxID=3363959 RepID=UPI00379CE67D
MAVEKISLDELTEALAATAADLDASGAFPHAQLKLVHEAGLLTAAVDPRYGGDGASFTDVSRILIALGAGDPSVALITTMTLVPHLLHRHQPWPEALYTRLVAESRQRPVLINHARAEPSTGSSTSGAPPATTARRTDDGWLISGRKAYVTGAEGLDYFLVWAATDETPVRAGVFLVPGDAPGIEILSTWRQLGMRATGSHEVVLTDVPVPRDHVIDLAEFGAPPPDVSPPPSAVLVISAALYLGVARAAQRFLHDFAHDRVPGNPARNAAGTERVRRAAGRIEVLLSTAEQLILGIAGRLDRGEPVSATDALSAKVVVIRHVTDAVQIAVRALGNRALAQDNPLERHFRDIQSAGVHAPVEDVAVSGIGAAVLR